MAIMKCKMCGGDLELAPGATVGECDFCGTKQTLPKANEQMVQNLFNRANLLRLKGEFDKAEQLYERILQEDNTEAEAHWGIVLCKYGIEYVEDPKTYRRVPTCHRTSYDALTADADYLATMEYADAAQRHIYEAEAKAIEALQKDILSIVKEEKPFDVFICYKETDEFGKRTVDSAIANDIYHQLVQEGLKVFYAAITLEDKLGQAYEPYIFAALNSAKVMLVIGTRPEYFTAVWVKNEWSRYLKLIKSDRSRLLIPCYRDMDAYELPEEFAHLQAQDMSKIGFISDVVRGIRKVTAKQTPTQSPAPTPAPESRGTQLILEDDTMYEGAVFAGIPHGYGRAQYTNGDIYEGNWSRGQRQGQGKLILARGGCWEGEFRDGECWSGKGFLYIVDDADFTFAYEGDYKEGKRHGYGKMEYANGVYEGQWANGKRQGQGKMTWEKGGCWEGEFLNDKRWTGYGTAHFADSVYEGLWLESKRHGRGKLTWHKGGCWEGEFREDRLWNGQGTVYTRSNDGFMLCYEGELKEGSRNGYGKIRYSDAWYEGQWLNGKKHGQGKLTWDRGGQWEGQFCNDVRWTGHGTVYSVSSDGYTLRYDGDYKEGKCSGFGTKRYNDAQYEGEWLDGKEHGQGKLTWDKGGQWEGQFREGERWTGYGTIYTKSKNGFSMRYDGDYKEGTYNGFGTMRYSDARYEGEWLDGKEHGRGKLTWDKGGQWEGQYREGERWTGYGTIYTKSKDGFSLRYDGDYKEGTYNGFGTMRYSDARYEGQWLNGKKHGQGKLIWDKGGQWEGQFREGERWNGQGKIYYSDAVYEGKLVDGKRHGQGKLTWDKGGQWEGEFRGGNPWSGKGMWPVDGNWENCRYIFGKRIYL